MYEFGIIGADLSGISINPLHANAESLVNGRSHDTVSMETHTHPS